MAVPASKRTDSSMAYIENADKLAAKAFRYSVRLPKRYTWKLGNPLFENAQMVVYHCRAANLIYVKDEATFNQRRAHLIEAEGYLLHVETLLGILYEVTSQLYEEGQTKKPNENVYREFSELIERERKLISGCKRRDTSAYNKGREAGSCGTP